MARNPVKTRTPGEDFCFFSRYLLFTKSITDTEKVHKQGVVMANAKSMMSEKVTSIPSSTDISAAVEIFVSKKFTSVPVVSGTGEIAGQLTEIVLIRLLVLSKGQPEKYKKLAHCLDLLEKPVFVEPMDSLATVLKCVIQSASKRVFVSLDKMHILGIISPKDLLKALSESEKISQAIQSQLEKT
jgi:CBS domain-containing protein